MIRFLLVLTVSLAGVFRSEGAMTVSLLTIEPGKDIYQLEGHTELRFEDPDEGIDMNVSWGVFDFDSPGFVYRFVKGETDYLTIGYPHQYFVSHIDESGRRVTSQRLNLSDAEAQRLYKLALENIKPENRIYRYNYVKDNCATRPLGLIEKALGDSLRSPADGVVNTTWRREMTRYHRNYPWYQFGIDLALGSGIDRELTLRETAYAPMALREYMSGLMRPDGSPAVSGEMEELMPGRRDGLPEAPTPWILSPMAAALLMLAVTMAVTLSCARRLEVPRWLYTILYLLSMTAGIVLTFLIFVSTHEATSPNWLYLWLNPLAMICVVGVWLKKLNRVVYYYQIVNFVALIALVLAGVAGIQKLNTAFYPLIGCYLVTAGVYIYVYYCKKIKKLTE